MEENEIDRYFGGRIYEYLFCPSRDWSWEMHSLDELTLIHSWELAHTPKTRQWAVVIKASIQLPDKRRNWCRKNILHPRYYEKEEIRLDPERISHNPIQRSIHKLMLNSLWGRFSMRDNLPQTLLVKDPEDFTGLLAKLMSWNSSHSS